MKDAGDIEDLQQVYFGAQHNLSSLIQTHLFVISPNNSGSTFVTGAIETCREIWRLPREGQHMLGYQGPDLLADKKELIWAADPKYLDSMRNNQLYDWTKTQKAWYFQSRSSHPKASVFLTKAPPFLLVVDQLREAFANARFLFLFRNPYAVIEGICRQTGHRFESRREALTTATSHVTNCLMLQRDNIASHSEISTSLSYEELCAHPAKAAKSVTQLIPQLQDLDFDQTLAVKGIYNERLRDMNSDQIDRLSAEDIAFIGEKLVDHQPLLRGFGYRLLGR